MDTSTGFSKKYYDTISFYDKANKQDIDTGGFGGGAAEVPVPPAPLGIVVESIDLPSLGTNVYAYAATPINVAGIVVPEAVGSLNPTTISSTDSVEYFLLLFAQQPDGRYTLYTLSDQPDTEQLVYFAGASVTAFVVNTNNTPVTDASGATYYLCEYTYQNEISSILAQNFPMIDGTAVPIAKVEPSGLVPEILYDENNAEAALGFATDGSPLSANTTRGSLGNNTLLVDGQTETVVQVAVSYVRDQSTEGEALFDSEFTEVSIILSDLVTTELPNYKLRVSYTYQDPMVAPETRVITLTPESAGFGLIEFTAADAAEIISFGRTLNTLIFSGAKQGYQTAFIAVGLELEGLLVGTAKNGTGSALTQPLGFSTGVRSYQDAVLAIANPVFYLPLYEASVGGVFENLAPRGGQFSDINEGQVEYGAQPLRNGKGASMHVLSNYSGGVNNAVESLDLYVPTPNFTMSCWFYFDSAEGGTGSRIIMGASGDSRYDGSTFNHQGFIEAVNANGIPRNIRFHWESSGGSNRFIYSDINLPLDAPVHIVAVRSESQKICTWYVDGVLAATVPYTAPDASSGGSNDMCLLCLEDGRSPAKGVYAQDFSVWESEIAEAEVANLYKIGSAQYVGNPYGALVPNNPLGTGQPAAEFNISASVNDANVTEYTLELLPELGEEFPNTINFAVDVDGVDLLLPWVDGKFSITTTDSKYADAHAYLFSELGNEIAVEFGILAPQGLTFGQFPDPTIVGLDLNSSSRVGDLSPELGQIVNGGSTILTIQFFTANSETLRSVVTVSGADRPEALVLNFNDTVVSYLYSAETDDYSVFLPLPQYSDLRNYVSSAAAAGLTDTTFRVLADNRYLVLGKFLGNLPGYNVNELITAIGFNVESGLDSFIGSVPALGSLTPAQFPESTTEITAISFIGSRPVRSGESTLNGYNVFILPDPSVGVFPLTAGITLTIDQYTVYASPLPDSVGVTPFYAGITGEPQLINYLNSNIDNPVPFKIELGLVGGTVVAVSPNNPNIVGADLNGVKFGGQFGVITKPEIPNLGRVGELYWRPSTNPNLEFEFVIAPATGTSFNLQTSGSVLVTGNLFDGVSGDGLMECVLDSNTGEYVSIYPATINNPPSTIVGSIRGWDIIPVVDCLVPAEWQDALGDTVYGFRVGSDGYFSPTTLPLGEEIVEFAVKPILPSFNLNTVSEIVLEISDTKIGEADFEYEYLDLEIAKPTDLSQENERGVLFRLYPRWVDSTNTASGKARAYVGTAIDTRLLELMQLDNQSLYITINKPYGNNRSVVTKVTVTEGPSNAGEGNYYVGCVDFPPAVNSPEGTNTGSGLSFGTAVPAFGSDAPELELSGIVAMVDIDTGLATGEVRILPKAGAPYLSNIGLRKVRVFDSSGDWSAIFSEVVDPIEGNVVWLSSTDPDLLNFISPDTIGEDIWFSVSSDIYVGATWIPDPFTTISNVDDFSTACDVSIVEANQPLIDTRSTKLSWQLDDSTLPLDISNYYITAEIEVINMVTSGTPNSGAGRIGTANGLNALAFDSNDLTKTKFWSATFNQSGVSNEVLLALGSQPYTIDAQFKIKSIVAKEI